jgi:DNA-binding NarL/FixJ family response regulator
MIKREKKLTLSERETQVVGMLNRGMRNKDIARELGLSPRTVCEYRHRAETKAILTARRELFRDEVN